MMNKFREEWTKIADHTLALQVPNGCLVRMGQRHEMTFVPDVRVGKKQDSEGKVVPHEFVLVAITKGPTT